MDRVTTARATTALGTMIAAMMIVDPTIAANAHHQKKTKALGRLSLPSAFFDTAETASTCADSDFSPSDR
jgi:hypothetical protein